MNEEKMIKTPRQTCIINIEFKPESRYCSTYSCDKKQLFYCEF